MTLLDCANLHVYTYTLPGTQVLTRTNLQFVGFVIELVFFYVSRMNHS